MTAARGGPVECRGSSGRADGRDKLLHALAHLDDLDCAGCRVRLDAAALGPGVGIVVVADIGEQELASVLWTMMRMSPLDPHRPEMRVARPLDAMEFQAGRRRVHLQIECRGLGGLLLRGGEARESGGEGVGDAEFHCSGSWPKIDHLAKSGRRVPSR